MRNFKRLCSLFLIVLTLTTNIFALGAEIRQFSITSDTTASELLDGLDWLDNSANGFQSKKFSQILNTICNSYYFGITSDEIYSSVFDGSLISLPQRNIDYIYSMLFTRLDQFSYYIPPMINSIFEDPHYSGYGIVIYDTKRSKYDSLDEGLYIEEVYADSPASKAGIMPNDKVISINGIKVENLTLNSLNMLLSYYGDSDECSIVVKRDEEFLNFDITKDFVPVNNLMTTYYPDYSTAHFDISAFDSSTLESVFAQAVKETYEAGYKNIIIDLRDNPGGVVDYAMNTTDTLITKEHTLFTFLSKGEQPFMSYRSDEFGYDFENIYILVNENTASAAEAMTISLKSLSDAVIVGTTTYGKEVGQIIHQMSDNSYFSLTTIKGFGPNGEDYNTIGIKPDYYIENTLVEFALPENYLPLGEEQISMIKDGGDSDAILALEQRFNIINLLPDKYVDGIYDENLDACIKILQTIRGYKQGDLQPELIDYINQAVDSYHGTSSVPEDNQLDFVMNLIMQKSTSK